MSLFLSISSCLSSRADYVHVIEMLEMLLEHRMSTPFRNPVDLKVFPDYLQTIKKPMGKTYQFVFQSKISFLQTSVQ